MKHRIAVFTLALLACVVSVSSVYAHHGNASYVTEKTVVVKGKVTQYIWSNPHVFLKVDAPDETGTLQHWTIEAQNPVAQANSGWSKTTFKPGDDVDIDVTPARNGIAVGRFKGRIVINGQTFKP